MEKKSSPEITVESLPSISQASSSSSAAANAAAEHQVRVLHRSEYKQAALCLAEAFKDDDVVMYFVKTGDRKKFSADDEWKLHLHIMECITYAHCISGLATVVGPNYDCVALWYVPSASPNSLLKFPRLAPTSPSTQVKLSEAKLTRAFFERNRMPPNQNMDDFCTMLWSGMFGLNWKLSKEGKKRFFDEFLPLLHDTKHRVLGKENDANSWYLVYIGTKPGSRGKGYAKSLIEYTTKQVEYLFLIPIYPTHHVKKSFHEKGGFAFINEMLYTLGRHR